MNNIKAFLFDVDGTLIDYDGKMSKKMFDMLHILKDKGYFLGINSGRPVFSSMRVLKDNNADKLFDCYYGCNGIEYYANNKSTYLSYLDHDEIAYLNKIFIEDYLALACYKGDTLLFNHFPKDQNMVNVWCKLRYVKPLLYDFNKIDKSPKLIVVFLKEYKEKLVEKISKIHDERFDMFFSGPEVMEIVPVGLNKGYAVDDLSKRLNIDSKCIMTCGDAENDIPALIKGTGVYIDGQNKNVLYNCDSISNDGLALFLEKHFK